MLLDNLGLVGCKERSSELSKMKAFKVLPGIMFIVLSGVMALVDSSAGIPAIIPSFR